MSVYIRLGQVRSRSCYARLDQEISDYTSLVHVRTS
jgi:hypothetical protein